MATERALQVLHLEDNEGDRELVGHALLAEGLECKFTIVKTKAAFEAALGATTFDIIISDFSIPAYDGLAALRIAQKTQPEAPFIFVSGTIGEEKAVESLKSGATDYVLKDRLERLGSAVRRALREASERTLRKQAEERLRYVLAKSPAIIYVLKVEGDLVAADWVSDNIEQLLGYTAREACRPGWWNSILHPDDRNSALAAVRQIFTESQMTLEYRVQAKGRDYRWVRDDQRLLRNPGGEPVEIIGSWMDITERKQLEEQLRQAQKMEAIGQLAGGVAHDFNNLLTVIRGNTELFLMSQEQCSDESRDWLNQVVQASERATGLTRQLLAFSRKQVMQSQTLSLTNVIDDLIKMLGRIIGADIQLHCDCAAGLPFIKGDPGMIEQILMNLIVNARDAMPNGGELFISAEAAVFDERTARQHPEARAGDFVRLSVRDTGCGMQPETLKRIFEPFFTTKESGKGTGLGLATVYGIVKQHQGWVEVTSAPGRGTAFQIYLPAISSPSVEEAGAAGEAPIRGGTETILLVEDDESVRLLVNRVLKNMGYKIYEAVSGKAALEVWQARGSEIDLLLTDIVMPDGMTGQDLAERLRPQKPGLKVILSSGHSHAATGKDTDFFRRNRSHFLQKPYSSRALAQLVRECLDGD